MAPPGMQCTFAMDLAWRLSGVPSLIDQTLLDGQPISRLALGGCFDIEVPEAHLDRCHIVRRQLWGRLAEPYVDWVPEKNVP